MVVALRDDDGDRAVTGAAAVGIAAATPSIDLLDRLAPTVWCCAAGGISVFAKIVIGRFRATVAIGR